MEHTTPGPLVFLPRVLCAVAPVEPSLWLFVKVLVPLVQAQLRYPAQVFLCILDEDFRLEGQPSVQYSPEERMVALLETMSITAPQVSVFFQSQLPELPRLQYFIGRVSERTPVIEDGGTPDARFTQSQLRIRSDVAHTSVLALAMGLKATQVILPSGADEVANGCNALATQIDWNTFRACAGFPVVEIANPNDGPLLGKGLLPMGCSASEGVPLIDRGVSIADEIGWGSFSGDQKKTLVRNWCVQFRQDGLLTLLDHSPDQVQLVGETLFGGISRKVRQSNRKIIRALDKSDLQASQLRVAAKRVRVELRRTISEFRSAFLEAKNVV